MAKLIVSAVRGGRNALPDFGLFPRLEDLMPNL